MPSQAGPFFRLVAVLVMLLLGTSWLILYYEAHRALRAKNAATIFQQPLPVVSVPPNAQGGETMDGPPIRRAVLRAEPRWHKLGGGKESEVFTVKGSLPVAIKKYHHDVTARSCYQPEAGRERRIPTEILAGLSLNNGTQHRAGQPLEKEQSFLPIIDYFMIKAKYPIQHFQWVVITPLCDGGDLDTLAKTTRESAWIQSTSISTLDAHFRPSLHRILRGLHEMHAERKLCHDDLKGDNIFVSRRGDSSSTTSTDSPAGTSWVIADLNAVRHISHPYHTSRLWLGSNKQLKDCRANDVRRMIKTYLKFLRLCLPEEQRHRSFDKAFFDGAQPWSRLYWKSLELLENKGDDFEGIAAVVLELSQNLDPSTSGSGSRVATSVARLAPPSLLKQMMRWEARMSLENRVKDELITGMKINTNWAKVVVMTWLIGEPARDCE